MWLKLTSILIFAFFSVRSVLLHNYTFTQAERAFLAHWGKQYGDQITKLYNSLLHLCNPVMTNVQRHDSRAPNYVL